jgi:hypothetical protein
LNASSPPAEAPTPTTGKSLDAGCPVLCLFFDLAIHQQDFHESYALMIKPIQTWITNPGSPDPGIGPAFNKESGQQ